MSCFKVDGIHKWQTMLSLKSFSFSSSSGSLLIRPTKPKHHSHSAVQKDRRSHHYHSIIYHFTAGQHRNPTQVTTTLCQVLHTTNSSSCFRKCEICEHIYRQVCGTLETPFMVTWTNASVGIQKCLLQDTNTCGFLRARVQCSFTSMEE